MMHQARCRCQPAAFCLHTNPAVQTVSNALSGSGCHNGCDCDGCDGIQQSDSPRPSHVLSDVCCCILCLLCCSPYPAPVRAVDWALCFDDYEFIGLRDLQSISSLLLWKQFEQSQGKTNVFVRKDAFNGTFCASQYTLDLVAAVGLMPTPGPSESPEMPPHVRSVASALRQLQQLIVTLRPRLEPTFGSHMLWCFNPLEEPWSPATSKALQLGRLRA
jgi:hypothetical protein